jgi:hypothetical protein
MFIDTILVKRMGKYDLYTVQDCESIYVFIHEIFELESRKNMKDGLYRGISNRIVLFLKPPLAGAPCSVFKSIRLCSVSYEKFVEKQIFAAIF